MTTTYNNTAYFTFGSPRYNSFNNLPSILIPEDYNYYSNLNGTYDKFFPLYRLTSSSEPSLELVNNQSVSVPVVGALGMLLNSYKSRKEIHGAIASTAKPTNKSLEKQTVSHSYWSSIRLNPGWSLIQQQRTGTTPETYVYAPTLIVRSLGNALSMSQIHAVNLDDEKSPDVQWTNEKFPVGIIVQYKNNLFKCVKSTNKLPPAKLTVPGQSNNEDWSLLVSDGNVFNADIFVLSPDGGTAYLTEVSDTKRTFFPSRELENEELVCWNLSYYHSRS